MYAAQRGHIAIVTYLVEETSAQGNATCNAGFHLGGWGALAHP